MDMSCIAVSVIERGQKKLLLILKFLAMALMWYIAPVAAGYIAEQLLKEKRKRNLHRYLMGNMILFPLFFYADMDDCRGTCIAHCYSNDDPESKKDQITAGYIGNEKHYFGCDCDIGTDRI